MKKLTLERSPVLFYGLIIGLCGLVVYYLFCVVTAYYGVLRYQEFLHAVTVAKRQPDKALPHDQIVQKIQAAIRYDRNHPEYYYALGHYLHEYSADPDTPLTPEARSEGLQEAETWLKQAILLDPANPRYFYEMGRLSYNRGDCQFRRKGAEGDNQEACPAVRYFLAALQNAPHKLTMRTQIIRWFYQYDREIARQLIRETLEDQAQRFIRSPGVSLVFAEFLYDIQMDYASDQEMERILPPEQVPGIRCAEASGVFDAAEGGAELVLQADDGSGEWKARLASDTERVKKIFCLPENLSGYRSATVKILMNRALPTPVEVQIGLNEHRLSLPPDRLSVVPEWHEIPVDMDVFAGQRQVTVYVRAWSSDPENALYVWGDADTPTARSVLNFRQSRDLSPDPGIQRGEYLIRLVLSR